MNLFFDMFNKSKIVNYKLLFLSVILTLQLSTCSSKGIESNYFVNDVLDDNNFSSSSIFENFIFNYTNSVIGDLNKMKNPSNIDFSDFPYSDGSVESMLNIARYIREKVSDIPVLFQYEYVLEHFKFTPMEFLEFYATIYLEGKPGEGAYELSFANTTNVFNRVISKSYSDTVRNWISFEGPISLYQHITAPRQYSPYISGDYLNYIGYIEPESYLGCLNALFVMDVIPERMHNYLDFVANGRQHTKPGSVQIVPGGNWFSSLLLESDTIPLEERYYYELDKSLDKMALIRNLR